jgi:opacity protein-like surface antigen
MKKSVTTIMKTTSALVAFFTLAMVGIDTPARAADNPSNYVVVKGGFYAPSQSFDLSDYNGGSQNHFDSKTGIDGELDIGHYFLPMLAVEFGSGYFQSKNSSTADSTLKVVPVLLTGKVVLPLGIFEPYGEFGIGAYFTKLDVTGSVSNFSGTSDVAFGLHAGAGFNVDLSKQVFVGLEGRYLWARPDFGGQDIKINGFTTTANIGLRF